MKKQIVLFGGTFDPIHLGHTQVAHHACEYLGAEKVVFIPAKRSPLKGALPKASDDDRLRMVTLAIEGNSNFDFDDCELKKPAPSYTLDTIRLFKSKYPDAELYWLVGADGVDDLKYWYRITELLDECNMCTMYRAGFEMPEFSQYKGIWGEKRVEKLRQNVIPTPLIDISSTIIRQRVAVGEDVSDMVGEAVARYIYEYSLY